MRVLLDTDILLDVALERAPHAADSAAVLRWVESGGAAALAWRADAIVTRNLQDYRRSPVPALSPAAFLKQAAT